MLCYGRNRNEMMYESGQSYPQRAGERITDHILWVLSRAEEGFSLARIAKIPGAPGLRTMRRWCADSVLGFDEYYRSARYYSKCMRALTALGAQMDKFEWRYRGLS
jgi:hypothetical protein